LIELIDKKSLFGWRGHTPVEAGRTKRFHGEKFARIGVESQDQGKTLSGMFEGCQGQAAKAENSD